MDGTECNPLFSWDAGVRSVRVCYADVLLSGRIPNVKSWVVVQADPDCEVRVLEVSGKDVVVFGSRLVKPSWLVLSCKGTGCSVRRSLVVFLKLDEAKRLSSLTSVSARRYLVCLVQF